MRRKRGNGVPSEETVPHQDRYPVETAANMMIDTTAIPRSEINSNATFPLPKPSPAGGSSIGVGAGAAFMHDSHTDGRKRL